MPIAYINVTGQVQAYTPADREDVYKQWLVKQYNEEIFRKMTVPFCRYIHFKDTKDFGKFLTLALFADRLLDYTPD